MPLLARQRARILATSLALVACAEAKPSSGAAPDSAAATPEPVATAAATDAFYDPPATVPTEPGALLRSEPLRSVTLPDGMQGWRILYTTTVDDRTPALAAATVLAPARLPAGARPVIAWAHGTTGLVQRCMPSFLPVPTEGIPARDRIVAEGWVVVATDYQFAERGGPHPYLVGEGEARATLDAVRAARRMPELALDTRTVVWGHSQGGHASLWSGLVAPRYAPDVPLLGVVGVAPAADPLDIVRRSPAADKFLGPYVVRAYSRFYPDVTLEQALRPEALAASREVAGLCMVLPVADRERSVRLAMSFKGPALVAAADAPIRRRLAENAVAGRLAAPVLIVQGAADPLVTPAATGAWVEKSCADGSAIEYRTYPGLDHVGVVNDRTVDEELVAWTKARFDGGKAASACTRAAR